MLSAAILAGGQSRRMGMDKALLPLAGRTMLEVVAERVFAVASEVFVIASTGGAYEAFGLRVVPDAVPGSGSLGGVYTALINASSDQCLVVACDMPLLNVELLRHMSRSTGEYDVVIPSLSAQRSDQGMDETLETMHAIYRTSVSATFKRRIDAQEYKIATALADLRILRVTEATIRRFDPNLRSFFNVNTREDYEFARSVLEQPD